MTQISTRIVGVQYRVGAQTLLNRLRPGTPIELRREPDCPQDFNAIQCWHGEQWLGYIPRADNRQAAAAMDRGEQVVCAIHPTQPMVRLSWKAVRE